MNINNLTGHDVVIIGAGTFKGTPATRISLPQHNIDLGTFDCDEVKGIPVFENVYETNIKLPPKIEGTIYIVPSLVAQKIKRDDFYIIGEVVKSADRKTIMGCKGLCKNPRFTSITND